MKNKQASAFLYKTYFSTHMHEKNETAATVLTDEYVIAALSYHAELQCGNATVKSLAADKF